MIFPVILSLTFLFLFFNILLYISIKKAFAKKYFQTSENNISVVVAARNEEKNIPYLIDALDRQEYNKSLFEVIIIDDNSTDKTYDLASEQIKNKENFLIIKAEDKPFPGKKGALTIGIKKTSNDFVMITDADCIPQKKWLEFYSESFSNGYDFVFGVAPFIKGNSFTNNLTCFDNLRSSILTFTSALIGIPYSAAARNFGFKKSSFEKIKGYTNTLETLSGDDDLLLREAVKHKMKIGLAIKEGAFVYSRTKEKLGGLINQKARHTQTSLYYLPVNKFSLGFWHLLNLVFLFSPFLIFIDLIFLSLFLVKMITDLIIVYNVQKYFDYDFSPFKILYLQVVYELLLILHFLNALRGKTDWRN